MTRSSRSTRDTRGTRSSRSDVTDRLLDRFLAELRDLAPVAVWAHGSLGGGDYQEGRSDLDLIAVLERPITPGTVWRVARLHARLGAEPLAHKLHCSYLTPETAADGRQYIRDHYREGHRFIAP